MAQGVNLIVTGETVVVLVSTTPLIAIGVGYDNSISGLSATTTQAAIDELRALIQGGGSGGSDGQLDFSNPDNSALAGG